MVQPCVLVLACWVDNIGRDDAQLIEAGKIGSRGLAREDRVEEGRVDTNDLEDIEAMKAGEQGDNPSGVGLVVLVGIVARRDVAGVIHHEPQLQRRADEDLRERSA